MALAFIADLRNRYLSRADFRRKAEKNIIGQWFARHHAARLFRMAGGFIHSQTLAACVQLDLFEELADGAKSLEDLAAIHALDTARLEHLLEAATALRLLERRRRSRYALGPLGASLVDNPGVTAFIRHHALLYSDLLDPLAIYRENTATELSGLWRYPSGDDPTTTDAVREYSALMQASQRMIAEQVLDAFSFEGTRSLVDVGGGSGAFAVAAASRWPDLAVTVADLPPVADLAREALADAGMQRRVDVVGLDAASGEVPGSYDVVSLIRIVHDHDDDKALAILCNARAALAPEGTLLVAEPLAGTSTAGALNAAYFHVYLLAMGSGRPRTFRAMRRLLKKAGFSRIRRRRTRVPLLTSVITASP